MSSHPYTCISCSLAFADPGVQRQHYSTDLHRYNAKRKVAGLPPVTAHVFNEKILARRPAEAVQSLPEEDTTGKLSCQACRKNFASPNAYRDHLKSKKHKEAVFKNVSDLKIGQNDSATDVQDKIKPERIDPSLEFPDLDKVLDDVEPVASSSQQAAEANDPTERAIDAMIARRLACAPRIKPLGCLFCPTQHRSLQAKLDHMLADHGFFVPDAEYLADQEGLVAYLGEQIAGWNVCLYCTATFSPSAPPTSATTTEDERRAAKKGLEAVRRHMIDKQHCKVAWDTESERLLLSDYYDYRPSYPDHEGWEDVDEDEELGSDVEMVTEAQDDELEIGDEPRSRLGTGSVSLGDSPYELVLPSGRRIGHRDLRFIYKQNLLPYLNDTSNRRTKLIGQLASADHQRKSNSSALIPSKGGFGQYGGGGQLMKAPNAGEARRANRSTRLHLDQRKRADHYTRVAIKVHNSQKHYRDPLLQRSNAAPILPSYLFRQKVNHFPDEEARYGPKELSKGYFDQVYTVNTTAYKRGGPVFLHISGETSAQSRWRYATTGYLAKLAQATGGIVIIHECRYYGTSWPFESLTTDNMRFLTTEQMIADVAYFAQTVRIPGLEHLDLTAPKTPWILTGGSLAGALTAFAKVQYPDIFFGAIASSATVQSFFGFPQWYYAPREHAPRECMAIVEKTVERMDKLFATGNKNRIREFKKLFGLASVLDNRDFAMAVASPIGATWNYPTNGWQELQWGPYGSNDFHAFCANLTSPSIDKELDKQHGVHHLTNYAKYVREQVVTTCPQGKELNSNDCFGTQDAAAWASTALSESRSYAWGGCTEAGFYNQAATDGGPSLISQSVQPSYTEEWCKKAFPPGRYAHLPSQPDLTKESRFGGALMSEDRLAFIDGSNDPWRYATPNSPDLPPRPDSLLRPAHIIPGGSHHSDCYGLTDPELEPPPIRAVHAYQEKFVKSWLETDFPAWQRKFSD